MVRLVGVTVLCNYPDDEAEAALPSEMTSEELVQAIRALLVKEQDMTSFTITAAIDRRKR